ncbi:glutamyl aminopeptidase-like isoform X2 [Montipora capricornis]|uniref:glutamyl aminopeptidase-like isoform X2 n=1 Tax=Montipora capricornis TaxID=246305 RepID=UPI0035F1AB56
MGSKALIVQDSPGVFVSKTKIVLCGVVLLLLLIVIIILAAVLGHTRSKLAALEKEDEEATPSVVIPTSTPGPTTAGTEVWWNVRLPNNIVPDHYDVLLSIDLENSKFSGEVDILVNVTEPTENVLVHVNKMNVSSALVVKASSGDQLEIQRKFWFEKNQFYVIILNSVLEKGTQYKIRMKFKAELTDDLAGLYKSTYKMRNGTEVTIAATQFQPTDARRAFPCFDEPALKATFNVTLEHHPKYISISNMPIDKTEKKNGLQLDHFQKTPIMPTYLLAFVVCDFAKKTRTTGSGTKMTFYAPPDQIDQVDYAMENGVKMLEYMEAYFEIRYPLPKADMIAIPDFAAGAMENWGLITYRETALLIKSGESAESNKKRVAAVVSHELAHQWFGNLVTMEWWDDLWLNEGFASFVEYYGVNATQPGWKMLDSFVVADMVSAFTLDGLANSHPIKVPVEHPDQINEIFDSISYNKGASIIRMLQFYLGRHVFLKGLNRYLNKYRYGNARTDDLWNALQEETRVRGSYKKVKEMMDTWTLQMGYPVLNITNIGGEKYRVSQERFLYDRYANVTSKYKSDFGYKWVVPFTYFTSSNPVSTISKLLNKTAVEIDWNGSGWLKGNAGQTGFYRVNYEQTQWDQLANQMNLNHKVFKATDRAGLIDDAFNLARGGYIKYSVPLNITKYLKKEDEYVPWEAVDTSLNTIDHILPRSSPTHKYLEKYIYHQSLPLYQKLGFNDTGDHLEIYKRSIVLNAMCGVGEASCLSNASYYFKRWMEYNKPVPANLRLLVYFYGIRNGGVKEWDFAFKQFQKTTVASERRNILYGLSGSSEPWILIRYLEYSLDSTKIKLQDTSRVIYNVANYNPQGRHLTWQFVKLNWDFLLKRFGGGFFAIRNVILGVARGFSTEFDLQELKKFNEKHAARSGARAQQQALEGVMANVQWLKRNEEDIENWLKDYLVANNIPLP